MKTFSILAFAFLLPGLALAGPARSDGGALVDEAQPLDLQSGTVFAETEATAGRRFAVTLPGKKWTVSDFDSSFLGFASREVLGAEDGENAAEGGRTRFVFAPYRKGVGRLLFRGPDSEATVLVHIREPSAARSPAAEPASEPEPPTAVEAVPAPAEPSAPLAPAVPLPGAAPAAGSEKTNPPADASSSKRGEARSGTKPPLPKKSETARDGKADEPSERMFYTDRRNRVVELGYRSEDEAYTRGLRFYQKSQAEKALEEFLAYLAECEACTHAQEVRLMAAELYSGQGKYAEALGHLEEAARSGAPEMRLKAYMMRAEIDLKNGDVKRAIEGYSAAWKIDARNRDLPRKIADLYYETRDYELALPLYERAVENGSADDEVYFRAATICESLGRVRNLEKAYTYYKAILDRFKGSAHAERARERVRFLERNFFDFK